MSEKKIGVLEPQYYTAEEFNQNFGIEVMEHGYFHCVACGHNWHCGRLIDDAEQFVPWSGLDCPACTAERMQRITEIEKYLDELVATGYERPNYARAMNQNDKAYLLERMTTCLDCLNGEEVTNQELHVLGEAYGYGGRVRQGPICEALDYSESTISRLRNQGRLPTGDYWNGPTVREGLEIVRYILNQQAKKVAKEERRLQKMAVLASDVEFHST